ncbi:hypothetical protein [Enterococcus gallinarum]|uniref:hypothetical protein n=1 Tax=Enterococcus gallinarum TaxID=1353 RepID=UPI0012E2369A|nr:hypothetical protein [Enterococcus gallinarum]MDL4909206.1 hypothetical protein [Enterococcus gallinarum]MUO32464.1 hypothetical protein [Enterococcus gallinarum]
MEILVNCPECHEHDNSFFAVEIDEGFFKGKDVYCNNKHKTFFISQDNRYQYLFQQAIESYNLGFYIESFSALHSGLDAYKKNFVAAFLYNESKDIEKVKDCLKSLNRSERIAGAFSSAYFSLSNGKSIEELPNKIVHFRNIVVHDGIIPSKKDCEKAGNSIFKLVSQANAVLWNRYDKEIDFHPIMQVYQMDITNSILDKKGFKTIFENPEEFEQRGYISHVFSLNILSSTSVIKDVDISDNLFSEAVKKRTFLISNFHAST